MSQWIWRFGAFEIYHNLQVHSKRQHYGAIEPVIWKLSTPDPLVCFKKEIYLEHAGKIYIHALGDFSVNVIGKTEGQKDFQIRKYGACDEILLLEGTVEIQIRVFNKDTFPALYVQGIVETDESWTVDDMTQNWQPAATWKKFSQLENTPDIFPFCYKRICADRKEFLNEGVLYDFGKETFAAVRIYGVGKKDTTEIVQVQFGESREEALDAEWSVIHFSEVPQKGELRFLPCAFRFLYVSDKNAKVEAEYEYLPLVFKGNFQCNEEVINDVWNTAAYTFHLNCREFFLDGIKRDRWVWAADAYQSLFVNHYLFMDQEIEKRTLIALGGKGRCQSHINTIMDYSFFWVISLWEYYKTYDDKFFQQQIFTQLKEVMMFCRQRTDQDGLLRERIGDWVFIDWAPMDKTGALCAEQILYVRALECYENICAVINECSQDAKNEAERVKALIFEKFYDRERNVFIDSYESGKRIVTRQSNILAYLFLGCNKEQKKEIYQQVILNPGVQKITTPYFKFYENQVHCEEGNIILLENSLREYYGGMLKLGATTLYEEFNPEMKGTEHYAMYGNPYEKSLCHAWSASPIYLLGKYRIGVRNTGIGYRSFEVRPVTGGLERFSGTVPLPDGEVRVCVEKTTVSVMATVKGGTFIYHGEEIALEPGREYVVCRE